MQQAEDIIRERLTLTFLMLQESHALRSLFVFCGCGES